LGPLGTAATNRPIVPAPGDYDDWQGKLKYSKKTCLCAILPTTNPHMLAGHEPGSLCWEASN
jgi:hypothetical protein